ncbi:hypothetical protein [Helicobacter labacensis]|uniref:hypothetical protein n=1 Tax=Helicobacter labacensis TaxID=2316079 RepID=UPI001F1CBE66|nr:hypothetical protein [Helicobacter labacensis]
MKSLLNSACQALLLLFLCLSGVYANGEADRYFDLGVNADEHENYTKALEYYQKAYHSKLMLMRL